MNKKHLIFFGGIALVSMLGYLRSLKLTNQLMENHIFGEGQITKVTYGGKRPKGIYFEIKGVNTKYRLSIGASSSCRKLVKQKIKKLKGIWFPVAYLKDRPSLSRILIFKSQYQEFNTPIPEHLKEIVEELSVCED